MTHIRRPLLGLLALIAGAAIVDRWGLGRSGDSALASWVYALALAAVAMPLVLPVLRRARPWAPATVTLGAYLILKALMPQSPGTGLFEIHLAAAEAALLGATALLAHRLASGLDGLDQALAAVGFGDYPALPLEGPQATNEILAEMARSRRHDRPLSVAVIEPTPDSFSGAVDLAGEEVQRALRTRYVRGRLARVIADHLRRSDLLFEDPATGRFVVLSPETSPEGAELLVGRIRGAAALLEIDVRSASASFPEHAIAFEQLLAQAEQRLAGITPQVPAPAPALRPVGGTDQAGSRA
jgi:hypothetical protein